MAEVLVTLRTTTHPDPVKDQRGAWKAGMPVVVMPDGHEWGAAEGLPRFFVVKLPGIDVAQVKGYIFPEFAAENYLPASNQLATDEVTVLRRREWQVMLGEVSAPMRAYILAHGEITIGPPQLGGQATWDQMKARLWSHRLGLYERRSAPRS